MTGNTTSTWIFLSFSPSITRSALSLIDGEIAAWESFEVSAHQLPSRIAAVPPSYRYQSPSFVIPTVTMSYFSRSAFSMIDEAEMRDTSYSVDLPPKRMRSVIFSILL